MKNVLLLSTGVAAGVFLSLLLNPDARLFGTSLSLQAQTYPMRRDNGYRFINPLLECEAGEAISQELQSIEYAAIDAITTEQQQKHLTHLSVYFRDLNNGPWFGVNEQEEFTLASLLKVPILMAYFKEAETNPDILKKEVTFEQKTNTNTPYFTGLHGIQLGKTYTIAQLIEAMIVSSDNDARDLLVLNSRPGQLERPFKDLGVPLPLDNFEMSVKEYASFFRILFNASYLSREYSEKALELLSRAEFKKGIVAGVPGTVSVAHKFGERWKSLADEKQLHDCGIVYYSQKPYLLCIMSRGDDFDELAAGVGRVSKAIYDAVDRQIKR